jgi:hypothetical protein
VAYQHTNSKGQQYYLHMRDVTLKGGRVQRIYFFARAEGEGACEDLPAGYQVIENARTGLPILKKATS